MKNILCLLFFLPAMHCLGKPQSTRDMNHGWEFRMSGDSAWHKASVPGCVHTDLMAAGIIPDPFSGETIDSLQWIENADWEYRKTFGLQRAIIKCPDIWLVFEGLDTYADVYCNDSLILHADDMFRPWKMNIAPFVRKGNNVLLVHFYSAAKQSRARADSFPLSLPGGDRVFTRKAQFQFGWDFAPRVLTCGIWKPVYLMASRKAYLEDVQLSTAMRNADTGIAQFNVQFAKSLKSNNKLHIQIRNTATDSLLYDGRVSSDVDSGIFTITIPHPALWWCNGNGSPTLYRFSVALLSKKKILDKKNTSGGFSTIRLMQENDARGSSFYFTLNSEPVFIKGANWVPMHMFPPAVSDADYRRMLTEAKTMHINMLRVWGGGIYEKPIFYALCDSLGIMVWQDCMFACGMYPDSLLQEEIPGEISYVQAQISAHPCLALWCGNNEIDEGWNNWDWQKDMHYSASDSAALYATYKRFFNHQLPALLKDSVNYIPTSPATGWGHPASLTGGDCHYWGVWWGMEPFDVFNQKVPRFMSEYGFQAMPSRALFQKYLPGDSLSMSDHGVLFHQMHPAGYQTIRTYMERDFPVPAGFSDYIYVSQLLQAECLQTAIKAQRRNRPACMGTMFWQLDEPWPGTSWSVIDFDGNRKAGYYAVRRNYRDLMLSTLQHSDTLIVYAVSDKREPVSCHLVWELLRTDGKVLRGNENPVVVAPETSAIILHLEIPELAADPDTSALLFYVSLEAEDSVFAEDFHAFAKPVNMTLHQPHFDIEYNTLCHCIRITSDVFAKNVYLSEGQNELKLSDNYFDLLPGKTKTVFIEQPVPDDLPGMLQVETFNAVEENGLFLGPQKK